MTSPVIVWFRHDLRLHDNPALIGAVQSGAPIIALYILDDYVAQPMGGASRWWLGKSLTALNAALTRMGGTLITREGAAEAVMDDVMRESGATHIYWNRDYVPNTCARDGRIKQKFSTTSYKGNVLFEPFEIKTKTGTPFKVFTPYYQACLARADLIGAPLGTPKVIQFYSKHIHSDTLRLMPTLDWAKGFDESQAPGEAGAYAQINGFCDDGLMGYQNRRDFPAIDGTSRMSAHLHFGEISPRVLWHQLGFQVGAQAYLRQLIWREFSTHLLWHNPDTIRVPLNAKFASFPYMQDAALLRAWQTGMTGYPIVDAGMRELWQTGIMHNRLRMIVGSFLVKHLLQPWQDGADWFWDTLVDADAANNTMGWQWIAGCGADAAPYFRVFNPVLQGQKFDAKGEYIRRFVPEVAHLDDKMIHTPWLSKRKLNYPAPIVDLAGGRERALAAYANLKDNYLP